MARQADLLTVEEAQSRILAQFRRLPPETVRLSDGLGRVLAAPLAAPIAVPPFANSSMDGFALRSADTEQATSGRPAILPIGGTIPAGSPGSVPLTPGTCARIMTGAPVPEEADAVVPFEEVEERDGSLLVSAPVHAGACIRPAGNDIRQGSHLLPPGTVLGAPQIGLLAALGLPQVSVTRHPVVAILATGEELVSPGQALAAGQIYNSNSPMLSAAVTEAGAIPLTLPPAGDDVASIAGALEGAAGTDLILTSGGASVGDFDLVKSVVGAEGNLDFWRVRVRPGKPLLFGQIGGTPVIGLPGNPTSAMVTFEEFARPAIRAMLGAPLMRAEVEVVLDAALDNHGGRRTYARVELSVRDGRLHASPSGGQDSAMLLPLARADGLLVIPEEVPGLAPGDTATVQVWRLPAS